MQQTHTETPRVGVRNFVPSTFAYHTDANQPQTMTSLQIAEITGKPHNDILKAIRKMEDAWAKINGGNFSLVEYTDNKGEKRPCYSLTKTECLYIATKFNDEARAKLVIRWEELEQQATGTPRLPQTFAQALRLAAEQQEQIERQALALERQAPKVAFANAMLSAKSSCLIGQLAKVLTQNGYETGQNRLFGWMRANGYLCRKGQRYNLPTQKAMEMGLFEIHHTTITKSNGEEEPKTTTKVTPKGQMYFLNKFLPR